MRDDDPNVVVVADPEPVESERKRRATTGDLLEAIRSIPDAVAARVGDGAPTGVKGGGTPEVTFAPEPAPEPDQDPEPDVAPAVEGPAPAQRAAFGFPGRHKRHRVEIGA